MELEWYLLFPPREIALSASFLIFPFGAYDLVFSKAYEFIVCTEAVEHFFEPAKEFKNIDRMLIKGGCFGLMTTFLDDEKGFGQWYYRKDPTHVAFYRPKTFEVIASIMNWTYEIPEKDVVIFKK